MAAIIGILKGKVLAQFGDGEPVEIGEIEIPVTTALDNGGWLEPAVTQVINDSGKPIAFRPFRGKDE